MLNKKQNAQLNIKYDIRFEKKKKRHTEKTKQEKVH